MKFACLSILFLSPFWLFAEKDSLKNYSVGFNYFGGKILIHTNKIHFKAPPYSQAVEFNFNKQTLGNAPWQQRFGFPETGLSIAIARHGHPALGTAFGLYPTIQFRLINNRQGYWYFKLGGGLALNTRSWHRTPTADTVYNILGSTLNNFTMLQTGYRIRLASNWSFQGGLHFYHVSNAGARKPNFGINTTGAHLGINYHPSGFRNHFISREDNTRERSFHVGLQSVVSFAEDKTLDGPLYGNYGFAVYGAKMYRGKNRYAFGTEATYLSKLYALFKNTKQYQGSERRHAWQYSVYAGHEFVFGKIGLPLTLGYYLNKPNGGAPIYQKLGISWHCYHRTQSVLKDIYVITQLKTHYANADFAEFGMGILF